MMQKILPSLGRFQGAMLCSAVGDALGWPTESVDPHGNRQPPFDVPLHDFVLPWQKVTGGKWWGYEEPIGPGEYSDDTQLALAVARCITETGTFEPERFAYQELPLWLQYERGGGKSVKTAARTLIGKNADWLRNFYKQAAFDYRSAGANGAAMRTLPIALVNSSDEGQMIRDSFLHAIITHGHPRAIIGAILFSLAVRYALTTSSNPAVEPCIEYLRNGIERVEPIMRCDDQLARWMHDWEKQNGGKETSFRHLFNETCQEAFHHLEGMPQLLHEEQRTYYTLVGALTSATRGSGLATVCVAIFLFLKYCDHPEEVLTAAVNAFGSDTDTIAVFLGALLGACHGLKAVPAHLFGHVQDQAYLLETAKRLHIIADREERASLLAQDRRLQREDAYRNILSWDKDFQKMLQDVLAVGDVVSHPTLGQGRLTQKLEKPIRREGSVGKLVTVQFECGQSCVFHSRVGRNGSMSGSLALDVESALRR